MRVFPRPKIVVSKCLGFAPCRYDGSVIPDPVVAALRPYVDFVPVCPELEIGLGVPRPPIRLVRNQQVKLIQPDTGRDLTPDMASFVQNFLRGLTAVEGFILKNRSPSCALYDAKIHVSPEGPAVGRGPGLFGAAIRQHFPDLPAEDEGRLTNRTIREHFLTAVFTLAAFREIKAKFDLGDLVNFHTEHKFLLMAQGQTKLRELGRIVANAKTLPPKDVFLRYEEALRRALLRPPRRPSLVNVLEHAFGYVSDGLSREERAYFLTLLQEFRRGHLPLSVPREVLRAWIIRFGVEYLARQTFFEPFPPDLLLPLDSGKGTD